MNCNFQRLLLMLVSDKFHRRVDPYIISNLIPLHVNGFNQRFIKTQTTKKEVLAEISKSSIAPYICNSSLALLNPFFKPKVCSGKIDYSFIVNNAVAEDISKKILSCHNEQHFELIEGNPGLGLLTSVLIKYGKKICVYENSNLNKITIKNFSKQSPNVIRVISENIFNNNFNSALESLLRSRFFKKIIGVAPSHSFLFGLVLGVINENLWSELHNTVFYIVTSQNTYNAIYCFQKSKCHFVTHCLLNLALDIVVISEYEERAFLPPLVGNEKMYLLRVSFKPNIFKDIKEEEYNNYYNFIKILSRSKYQFVIQILENWFPGCGVKLINEGILLCNQTRDLSYVESVKLFNIIKTCSSYQNFRILSKKI